MDQLVDNFGLVQVVNIHNDHTNQIAYVLRSFFVFLCFPARKRLSCRKKVFFVNCSHQNHSINESANQLIQQTSQPNELKIFNFVLRICSAVVYTESALFLSV